MGGITAQAQPTHCGDVGVHRGDGGIVGSLQQVEASLEAGQVVVGLGCAGLAGARLAGPAAGHRQVSGADVAQVDQHRRQADELSGGDQHGLAADQVEVVLDGVEH